jgi:hypothetical protein
METVSLEITFARRDYERLQHAAEERAQSAVELLNQLAADYLASVETRRINYHAVEDAYARHPGKFVAIREGRILAYGDTATQVLAEVKREYGLDSTKIMLTKTTAPDLHASHPRLESA